MKREKLGRNDPCHCGSELKYKKCHLEADLREGKIFFKEKIQAPTNKATLDKNTLDFISDLKESFGIEFDSEKDVGIVLGEVTREKVKRLYETVPIYFPHGSSFREICFDISRQAFNGFYWGNPNINSIASYITRYALYTPNIIIANPFCDMMIYHSDASPIDRPEAWLQIAINQALFLVSIEPWIKEGIITVLPPFKWFEPKIFNEEIVPLADKRMKSYDKSVMKRLMSTTFIQALKKFPPDQIESFLKLAMRGEVSPVFLKATQEISRIEYLKNPIRYNWLYGEGSSILKFGEGNNIESVILTSNLCNSYILFGEKNFRLLYDIAIEKTDEIQESSLTELSRAFADLEFSFLNAVRLDFVLGLRKEGRLIGLRKFLIKLWDQASSQDLFGRKNLYQIFKDELEGQYEDYKKEWADIKNTLKRNMANIVIGSGAAILSGQVGFKVAGGGIAAFGIEQLWKSYSKRKKQERLPLGVFLNLEKKAKK